MDELIREDLFKTDNKKEPETKKVKKENIKQLQKHCAKRFAFAVEAIQNNLIRKDDVLLLCDFEPSILKTLSVLYEQKENKENREKYIEPILQQKNDIFIELIKTAQKYVNIHSEEKRKLTMQEIDLPEQIELKNKNLEEYNTKINKALTAIDALNNIQSKMYPKRAVGRPKKEVIPQLIVDTGNIDKDIVELVKQLDADQKKYLKDYINKMLLTKQTITRLTEDDKQDYVS